MGPKQITLHCFVQTSRRPYTAQYTAHLLLFQNAVRLNDHNMIFAVTWQKNTATILWALTNRSLPSFMIGKAQDSNFNKCITIHLF